MKILTQLRGNSYPMGGVLPSPFSIKLRCPDEIPLTESAEKIMKLKKIAIDSDKLRGIGPIIVAVFG